MGVKYSIIVNYDEIDRRFLPYDNEKSYLKWETRMASFGMDGYAPLTTSCVNYTAVYGRETPNCDCVVHASHSNEQNLQYTFLLLLITLMQSIR
jgi:hypothetical protein